MNKSRVDEIKKEDKKAFKGFVIMLVIALIAEKILFAMFGNLKQAFGESVPSLLINTLEVITPFASLVLSILVTIVSKIVYTNSKKEYDLWKQTNEDDDTIDKIEEKLSYLIFLISVNIIFGFFFLGIASMLLPFDDVNGNPSIIKYLCFSIGTILFITSYILIQKKVINLQKEINPLLKGSVYDMNFSKKWLDSCDESIKLGIYKSSYKAYKSVSTTCLILFLFCVVGHDLWDFGIMPMVIVIIIWLVQTISYYIESIKYSKVK
ncbi:DUF3169 family protein [Romboutsia sedimentorum]|uniref:DUF3169 family protein n=1 Tax=Romboutsia sedimentorum TaxID=1368474 RepID=A0ABT7E5U9_9FIRM|nr:DUF3169 family protein [Romboutsia sedimentorum]MDK2562308.1 DUF3169 family protein [Romboutsia sedimentorum]